MVPRLYVVSLKSPNPESEPCPVTPPVTLRGASPIGCGWAEMHRYPDDLTRLDPEARLIIRHHT
jgi:hypothetical protein